MSINPTDIALSFNPEIGLYDISIVNDEDINVLDTQPLKGDLSPEYGFYTSLLISTFCERRADSTEVSPPQQRRGWWGNLFAFVTGYEIGSKLWILSQARNTPLTLTRAINYLQTAFQWYIDDKHLKRVNVTGVQTDFGIILDVQLLRFDNQVINISYNLWENTITVLGL